MFRRSPKEYLLLVFTCFTGIAILPFIVIRVSQQDWITATVDTIISCGMAIIFAYVYKTRKIEKPNKTLVLLAIIGVLVTVYVKGVSHVYWVHPAIIATYYLYQTRRAVVINALLVLIISIFISPQVEIIQLLTIFTTLVMTSIFACVFAVSAGKQHKVLIENEKISRLRNKTLELIVNSEKLSEILYSIVQNVELEYDDMMCSILLLDDSGKHLLGGAAPSLPDFYNQAINGVEIGDGVGSCGTAAYLGKRVVVEDIMTHPYWAPWTDLAAKAGLGSCWSEPIINSHGIVLGTFAIYHKEVKQPSSKDFELISQFAHLASISIEKEKSSQMIWQQANFDNLTALPNRRMMYEHLKQAINSAKRNKSKVAVAFLDLDEFKYVNDTLGHDIGDELLKETAIRIKNCIRDNDTVARLGGDEFVIILSDLNDMEGVEHVADKLLKQLSLPYYLNEEVVHSSVSIGITIYPDDTLTVESLLKNADQAMYGAKNLGRNNYHYFTESMRDNALSRMQLIQDLRDAIKNEEFFVVYQPIVNLQTGKTIKAEALIRWQHPSRGIVSPLDFIPLAEETGLIIDISDWMFQQILPLVTKWKQNYHPDFEVSINTSPLQYRDDTGNIRQWIKQLKNNNQNSTGIAFEITEHLLMENKDDVAKILKAAQSEGIAISIDDFGTGYSSLSYLQNYQTDYLKIDISFVQKLSTKYEDLALCEAIVAMANVLNIRTIAEGVETQEQKEILCNMGCDYGQGYLFSKPLIEEEFESFLGINESSKLDCEIAL